MKKEARLRRTLRILAGMNSNKIMPVLLFISATLLLIQTILYYYQLNIVVTDRQTVAIEALGENIFAVRMPESNILECYNNDHLAKIKKLNESGDGEYKKITFQLVDSIEIDRCDQVSKKKIYSYILDGLLHKNR